ncbi:CSC1-like protein [Actinidia chinensis var. chinensis]|uniref:CSC1-like protein n=1 Tax=Actinidia chinensis var. chinensis TaxID=1590841 RepID=A0A2R6S2R9_ACTCC|nr:CSC1-like protein [Actinidia chinensis var. chinensis]
MRYISPRLLNPMDSSQSSVIIAPMPSITANLSLSPLPYAPDGGGGDFEIAWYGNIQYLLNISAVGALTCVLVFLLVKLRSDHRRMPGPSAVASKLLAVWHATGREIGRHCGADAAQFLLIEGGSCGVLLATAILSLCVMLPVNLYGGSAPMDDQFSKTTVNHIAKGSPLLWIHFVFVVIVVVLVHFGINAIEQRLRITRFRDGYGNPSDHSAHSTAIFTIMVHGVPKTLGFDKAALVEYFQHKYPGKIYRVIVPMDLCALDDLVTELVEVRDDITKLVTNIESRVSMVEVEDGEYGELSSGGVWNRARLLWRRVRDYWDQILGELNFTDEEKLRKLQELRADLETEMAAYKEGRAKGAGVAFVVFKDVYTANKSVQDFRNEKKRRIGKFFSVMELQLQRNQWKVERAPLATDIYWNHLGSSKLSLKLRRVFVNTCLLLMLLFFSSPLAVISAIKSAGRIINAEAMDNAQIWLAWVQSSSWLATIIFQFLPNVLIFVSMYIVIPSALSYLSKFERHLTVSSEQRAALLKMVCFFLVNLILLRALVESSLEGAILKMGRCYLDGEDCKRIEQYMSASFLSRSCLSSLAFLITCTFLGISFDLLAPIPWIKKKLQKFRKNDMLQLVPERSEDYPLQSQDLEGLQRPLVPEGSFDTAVESNGIPHGATLSEIDLPGQVLSEYPISRTSPVPKQTFDFAQYYAFNLTIFALTMMYSSFAPLVVPVGAIYFGYRYVVDKYNFLFVYRVRGFPAGNDGRLMDTVLCIMRFCVDLFLLSMLLFFSVKGDSTKLQAIFTLGLLVMYKLLPSDDDNFQPALLQGIQTVDNVIDGPIDYEVFSKPKFEWDTNHL